MMRYSICLLTVFVCLPAFAQDAPPRSLDDRLEITLFAEDPLLNTPTGIDVDHKGRVWVIESNTHFPPEGYDGHPSDRLLILEDTNGDGKAEAKMFVDGFTHSMSVAARPIWLDPISFSEDDNPDELKQRTQVFLATRREILLLEDTDGDDQCDQQTRLVHLETEGNYPHNGLAGFAFDGLGNMYFGFGENLGADYKIIGRDGTTYSGGGEGGNIYQIQPDGTKLKHWATGFWNPHANCVDAFGNLFSVDNDPDSLPPCRLLHIIEGGDYGYRFRNGRKGLHPFTAWNGEIPGTLPMVAGTGEAPSGILAYEHDAFPEKYLGNLIVTSWGDHRIDRFQLKQKGTSFESVAEPFIVGGENFRPVGIALAPDGALYLSDWVLRDYKLHGKGRVWRIRAKNSQAKATKPSDILTCESPEVLNQYLHSSRLVDRRLAAQAMDGSYERYRTSDEDKERSESRRRADAEWNFVKSREWNQNSSGVLLPQQQSKLSVWKRDAQIPNRPFLAAAARNTLQLSDLEKPLLIQEFQNPKPVGEPQYPASVLKEQIRIQTLLVLRDHFPEDPELPQLAINSNSAKLKRLAVQWIAEENLTNLKPQVEALFNDPDLTPDLFLATLAALEMLDGKPPQEFDKTPPGKYVLPILKDDSKPANVRAIALQLIDPDDEELPAELVAELMKTENERLKTEAIRTASMSTKPDLTKPLAEIALDVGQPDQLRAEATVGLARHLSIDPDLKGILYLIGKSDKPLIAREALRSTRQVSKERPTEPFELKDKPNANAGRRLFYHPNGPGCFKCHTVHGRGGKIGPNLSTIGAAMTREKLIESIRKPSQEVAPQFTTWTMISTEGKAYTGMIVHENRGDTVLGLQDGTTIELKTADVEERMPQKTSVMPEKLEQQMTQREFEDLLKYLKSLR
ncbi:MAG: c-type cytochrome [Planctomycetaceae bacterium]|nr:c-type cytochrome [Planctomycetaceae bacterium]